MILSSSEFKWQNNKGEAEASALTVDFDSIRRCFDVRSERTNEIVSFIIEDYIQDEDKIINVYLSLCDRYMIAIIVRD